MNLSDFHTKTLNEKPSKMTLFLDDEATSEYLLITGLEAKSVAQARLNSQIAYAEMQEQAELIKDKFERLQITNDRTEEIQVALAMALVSGWSFNDKCDDAAKRKLLEENTGLCAKVIAHAAEPSEYFAKKQKGS
jgi:hypothetical protein